MDAMRSVAWSLGLTSLGCGLSGRRSNMLKNNIQGEPIYSTVGREIYAISTNYRFLQTVPSPYFGERPASGDAAGLINLTEPALRRLSSILPPSAHLPLRRLAALRSTSLAHVMGLASSDSAAACTCS